MAPEGLVGFTEEFTLNLGSVVSMAVFQDVLYVGWERLSLDSMAQLACLNSGKQRAMITAAAPASLDSKAGLSLQAEERLTALVWP